MSNQDLHADIDAQIAAGIIENDDPQAQAFRGTLAKYKETMDLIPTRSVSISQLKQWMSCKRKWALQRIYPDLTPKDFFAVGRAVHAALEIYNKTRGDLELALLAAKKELVPTTEHNFLDQFPLVEQMVSGYIEFDQNNKDYEILVNEIDFEVLTSPVELQEVKYLSSAQKQFLVKAKGVIDFVAVTVRDINTPGGIIPRGEIIAGEYKTAKQAGNIDYDTDSQATLYLMALSELLGVEVRYIVYNTLYKKLPKMPARLKDGGVSAQAITTTQEIYGAALIEAYGSVDAAPEKCQNLYYNLKNSSCNFFDRRYVKRDPVELDEMQQRLNVMIPQLNQDHYLITENFEFTGNYKFGHCYPNPGRDCPTMCEVRDKCLNLNRKQPILDLKPFSVKLKLKEFSVRLPQEANKMDSDMMLGDDE